MSTKLIDRKALCAKVPYSDHHILTLESRGEFPRRIVLSPRRVAWDEGEVDKWIAERKFKGLSAQGPLLHRACRVQPSIRLTQS